ncbi:MAG TPA: hypothetical protein VMZ52_03460 [Bryobacteraceae bacterium]|nr:hypothetical protein [Bryobacteraceae bacterium]
MRTKRSRAQAARRIKLIEGLLKAYEDRVKGNKEAEKVSLGEYIRLIQLQSELADTQPKEIKVQWIEKLESKQSLEE